MLAQAVLQCWLGGVRAAGRIGCRRTAISLIGRRNTLLPFIAQEADGMRSIIRVFPTLGVRREFAASSRRWRSCTPVNVLQANDIVLVELAEGDHEDPYSRLPDSTKTVGSPAGYENPLPRFRPEDPIT